MDRESRMFRVKEHLHVQAPIERVFLLATSVPLVEQILGLKPVAGKTTGLIQDGDRVEWRGWKFGMPVRHETLISAYDAPHFFQDTMGRGRFKFFQHDHQFDEVDGKTLMVDIVRFSLPFGPAGKMFAKTVMIPHVLELMMKRFQLLKRVAEGDEWKKYLENGDRL